MSTLRHCRQNEGTAMRKLLSCVRQILAGKRLTSTDLTHSRGIKNAPLKGGWADPSWVQLNVNGIDRTFHGDPNMPLLWYLRDVSGGSPGQSSVVAWPSVAPAPSTRMVKEAIRSCITPVSAVVDNKIRNDRGHRSKRTASGSGRMDRSKRSTVRYWQSGQIMQAIAMLTRKAAL